jgi:hypothetical protein
MTIQGWKDRSDKINVDLFSQFKLIKVTVLRSWFASIDGSGGILEQRDAFQAENRGRDASMAYSEEFNMGTTPVNRLLANGNPSPLLSKGGYVLCVVLLLAWPWRYYFECSCSRTTLAVKKEVNNQWDGLSNEPVAHFSSGSHSPDADRPTSFIGNAPLADHGLNMHDDAPPAYEDLEPVKGNL